jgi:arylsulfatase A
MRRREFLKASGIGIAALAIQGCTDAVKTVANAEISSKPNIVVILCDDLGYADIGCFGAKGISTPNLDAMAAAGMKFTDFYAAPACSPSRAALLTGCYPQRVGMPGVLHPKSETGLSNQELTIADILRSQGYVTACCGKWHVGDYPEFLPLRRGFDEFFGLPYSNDMISSQPPYVEPNKADLPFYNGDKIIERNPDQSQLTTRYTEYAVSFIEKNRHKPFFLYLAHSMPHTPIHVSDKFKGKSQRGLYGDVVMEIDWSVGQVLSTLKRLGIDEKTLVVFTSDNGPWLLYGDHGGSAQPLREGKATTFEGGLREPCIMYWPGKIPAGSVCSELTTTMDLLPTAAKLAGAKVPYDRIIDGKDIWPLMSGQPGAKSPYEAFYYYWIDELQAVRSGKWKLHVPHKTYMNEETGFGGKMGKWGLKDTPGALYDLETDIGEEHDVSAQHPDVVGRLSGLMDKMRDDLGDSLTDRKGKNRRPAGQHL